ncbi:MAG: four helix bundle protein [Acidobacteria bacterium]|nr:four helix bundle protein [Acidobacteriota bacterium]MCL5286963.1 four helix bundle protein [Acidobacteriota bacterium]
MLAGAKKVTRFEDLNVYQQARELCQRVYALTRSGAISKDYGLRDQMRRSAVSIVSNIAEGFERQSNAEFARFLYVAKGSCGELRAQAQVGSDEKYWDTAAQEEISGRCRKLSAGLSNFISYLERSAVTRRQRTAAP